MTLITIETVINNMPKNSKGNDSIQKEFLIKQTSSKGKGGNLLQFISQENWQNAAIQAADTFYGKIGETSPEREVKIGHGLIALAGQDPRYKKRAVWEKNSSDVIEALEAAVMAAGNIALSIRNLPEYLYAKLSSGHIPTKDFHESNTIKNEIDKTEYDLRKLTEEIETEGYFDATNEIDARNRILTSIVQRGGQKVFREQLLKAYSNRCAITGCDVICALEAAHILPYKGEHTNNVKNGLLLRADIHTLFDLGKISINPDNYHITLSNDILESSYSDLNDKPITLPQNDNHKPDKEALKIHFDSSDI